MSLKAGSLVLVAPREAEGSQRRCSSSSCQETLFFSCDKKEASGVLFLMPSPQKEMSVSALLRSGDTSTGSAGISSSALLVLANRR